MKHNLGCFYSLAVVLLVCFLQLAECTTFTLGGEGVGWTNTANIDYNKWLSDYKIKIGDTLAFENDDTTDHSVVLVDKLGYDSCGDQGTKLSSPFTISPGITYTLTFGESGQGYAICAMPGHCLQGMKVFVQVLNADGSVNQTAAAADAPKANSATSAMAGFSWTSQLLVLVVATFSTMVVATTMFA